MLQDFLSLGAQDQLREENPQCLINKSNPCQAILCPRPSLGDHRSLTKAIGIANEQHGESATWLSRFRSMEQAEKYKRECVLHERCSLNMSISVCYDHGSFWILWESHVMTKLKYRNHQFYFASLDVWTFMEKAPQIVNRRKSNYESYLYLLLSSRFWYG